MASPDRGGARLQAPTSARCVKGNPRCTWVRRGNCTMYGQLRQRGRGRRGAGGRQAGRPLPAEAAGLPQRRGRDVPRRRAGGGSPERCVPGEARGASAARPTPRGASGSARELFIHKKKDKTPRASESEPQRPTRTPPSIQPRGMYRDFGEPGPSSGAGGAYGRPALPPPAQAQPAQQQVRLAGPPGRTRVWTALGMLG